MNNTPAAHFVNYHVPECNGEACLDDDALRCVRLAGTLVPRVGDTVWLQGEDLAERLLCVLSLRWMVFDRRRPTCAAERHVTADVFLGRATEE